MKPQFWLTCLIVAGALAVAAPANALVQVVGVGMAHECFLAAKAGVNLDEGLRICNSALEDGNLSYHDRAGTFVNRGVVYAGMGRQELAMADYNSGIRLTPDLGDAYIDRGAAKIFLKQYDGALEDINKGIALGMSYPHLGYYNRAVAEELMGKYKESYYDFKHVLELEPNFTMASDQLKNFIVTTIPDKS